MRQTGPGAGSHWGVRLGQTAWGPLNPGVYSFSHFPILIQKKGARPSQTGQEASLKGPLPSPDKYAVDKGGQRLGLKKGRMEGMVRSIDHAQGLLPN